LGRLRNIVAGLRGRAAYYRRVLRHPRTPLVSKVLLAVAVGYLALPVDIVPDFLPVLGYLDDLVIVGGLVALAVALVPRDVLAECRRDGSG
jgi:uncharacterized membrane protein YkvA (DUF1232 family)